MDNIKEAFQKVKQDIDSLKQEFSSLYSGLTETRERMIELCEIINELNHKINLNNNSTNKEDIPTHSTQTSTVRQEIKGLKPYFLGISTGNQGVPTDRQTDQQTDKIREKSPENSFEKATEILDSLDNLKKELRLKFKRLTEQEFLVFSTIYQLEEEQGYTDYKMISNKLTLSESSVRDYVQRIIKKGISVDKKRINNKIIHLSISENIKKIAKLPTILKLRDI
ncbi:MAG: hypothetical protein Q8P15_01725 [Nanoarchaeota archaeon]|nr:hypothetical protein [Nanoarchaeota archaeon]